MIKKEYPEMTTERRNQILAKSKKSLRELKDEFPEIRSITVYLSQLNGYSTLRIFLPKATETIPFPNPIISDEQHNFYSNNSLVQRSLSPASDTLSDLGDEFLSS